MSEPDGPRRNRLQRELDALRASAPGRRFEEGHERHRLHSRIARIVIIGIGITMIVVAGVTFWLPGPNFVIALIGAALVAGQWRFIAQRIDVGEVVVRRWHDERWEPYPHKRRVIALAWLVFATLVAAVVAVAWRLGLLPSWVQILG